MGNNYESENSIISNSHAHARNYAYSDTFTIFEQGYEMDIIESWDHLANNI